MALTRRQLLQMVGGSVTGAAVVAACRPAIRKFLEQSPARLPEDLVTGVDNWYATLCRQCPSGCGTIVRVIEGRAKKVEGNPLSPINAGKLCVRGQAGVQALYHPDRIRRPLRAAGGRGSGNFTEVSWDDALSEVVAKLKDVRGAGAGSAVLMTEPLNGYLGGLVGLFARSYGADHVAFEPMEQTALRQALKHVYGQDLVPFFDIAGARYLLGFGADFLAGWLSQVQHSRGYGEFRQGERQRGYFVQVDSRFSPTAANGDEWVAVRPGAEGLLALGIAYVLAREGLADRAALNVITVNKGITALEPFAPDRIAGATGVKADRIEKLAKDFGSRDNQPALAFGGGSAGAQTNGFFNLTAIYALNLLVGNVGKPGGVILNPEPPITDSRLFTPEAPVAPARLTSFKQVRTTIDRMRSGKVRALLVKDVDPVHGLPSRLEVSAALDQVPFIVSFSSFLDDTTFSADVVLPSHASLEDWGMSVADPGPGFEAIAFQQPVVNPFNETKGFGDILLTLAQELGLEKDLPWNTFKDLLQEAVRKLQQLNRGSVAGSSFDAYWNDLLRQGGWQDPKATAKIAPRTRPLPLDQARAEFSGSEGDYPFILVPFEGVGIGDGRGAHLPWMQATPDPITTATWETWVEMNLALAKEMGLKEGQVVNVESPAGKITALVYPNPATPPWALGVPVGQGHRAFGRWAEGRGSNVLSILDPDKVDRETGALAWGATRVRLSRVEVRGRIPKMEGAVFAVDISPERIVKITRGA